MTKQPSLTMDHLIVKLSDRKAKTEILNEWIWLIGPGRRSLLVAACGHVFVEDARDGTVHFLDVSAARCSPVAETGEAFESLLSEPAFVDAYLYPQRVAMLRRHGLLLKKNQIYSFRVPLSLGGEVTVENIEIADVEVHFTVAGQIECQIADVQTGMPITSIKTV